MFQEISLLDLFDLQTKNSHTLVDVRSPKEYEEGSIPGSVNIPIFTTAERAEIGTLYKQAGPERAKERGLAIFSQKLPKFVADCKKLETPITVFCWRGGMRSKSAATVLDLMGVSVYRLRGGIKSYRRWVVSTLEKEDFAPAMIVLNGYTGTGKTKILRQLQQTGYPVIDFEGLADHRGSIFGHIGRRPRNQKTFESLLVEELIRYSDTPYVIVEGESKRVGKIAIPSFIFNKKEAGVQLFIDLPMDERINNVLEDYQPAQHRAQFWEAFQRIKKRIHTPIAVQIENDLQNNRFADAVKLLLEYYYDPRYEHSTSHFPDDKKITITAINTEDALEQVENLLQTTFHLHSTKKRC
ncbi:tRNA 2-selenouridine(34) synthase MnmH [Bacillus piscicola]|uniref:tRNA 2-selenouridine(34) synthase MnmH n=1 Tax=Bacillus piscicola TaxID=1632684 RepID=UPI001F09BFDD|nr:tRNA 2-selenouridine(34) synthase MnmH [Bacillus piscicola]